MSAHSFILRIEGGILYIIGIIFIVYENSIKEGEIDKENNVGQWYVVWTLCTVSPL